MWLTLRQNHMYSRSYVTSSLQLYSETLQVFFFFFSFRDFHLITNNDQSQCQNTAVQDSVSDRLVWQYYTRVTSIVYFKRDFKYILPKGVPFIQMFFPKQHCIAVCGNGTDKTRLWISLSQRAVLFFSFYTQ